VAPGSSVQLSDSRDGGGDSVRVDARGGRLVQLQTLQTLKLCLKHTQTCSSCRGGLGGLLHAPLCPFELQPRR